MKPRGARKRLLPLAITELLQQPRHLLFKPVAFSCVTEICRKYLSNSCGTRVVPVKKRIIDHDREDDPCIPLLFLFDTALYFVGNPIFGQ